MSRQPLSRKALLAKAEALVWRLKLRVVAMTLRRERADRIDRTLYMMVAEALR